MPVGSKSAVIPFQIPIGADSSSATGTFEIFSSGGTGNVTVQLLAANGAQIKQGSVHVTGDQPGTTNAIFANLFDPNANGSTLALGMVRFATTDAITFQVVFQLQASTSFAQITQNLNYPGTEFAAGVLFAISGIPTTPQVVVSNHTAGSIQVLTTPGGSVTIPANNTVAINDGNGDHQFIKVTSGTGASVSYAGASVPAIS